MNIIVVEDDIMLQEELIHLLTKEGYQAEAIRDFANDVPGQIIALAPALVLLDINLPNQSGFEICRMLKGRGTVPILVLTSRDRLADELHALDLGADDYLTKPFHKEKLLARVRNLLRRFEGGQKLLDGGAFQLDPQTFTLYAGDKATVLPPNEGRILLVLLQNRNQVATKAMLSDALWGTQDYIDENALQVNMTRLRKTLRTVGLSDVMETIRGQGYRLRDET